MKKILILGGGYGGLKCFIRLQKLLKDENVSVTLLSKHDYHYATTLLHKVAIGTYSARKARIFYRQLIKKPNFKFEKEIVERIDIENKLVIGKRANFKYDYLVIALGFEVNSYGLKGVDEFALKINSMNSAIDIRKHIESKFKDYYLTKDENDLKFVICGSGFTGVEFAAELATQVGTLSLNSGIDREKVKIYLIGRSEQILPMFKEKMSKMAKSKLQNLGIDIVKASVIECKKNGVMIKNNDDEISQIYANTVLWTAGIKGSYVIEESNFKHKNSRVEVDEFLRLPGSDSVFIVGDCAIANDRDIRHAPTAQLAYQMGDYVAQNLISLLNGKEISKAFKFKHRGTVCSIGHTDAVAQVGNLSFSGELAAFTKNFIENKWIYSIAGFLAVLKKGQFRFRSSD